jgi:uroporphyrinogen decarboxylase
MNSYQRVMTAMECREPDRVPIVEWAISRKVIKALSPAARDQTDIEELLDLDGVSTVAQYDRVFENADGSYVDEWGITYRPTPEEIDHPIRGPIRTMDDLKKYVPPDPDAPQRLGKLPELVARFKGKKAIFFRHRASFMWSVFLNGFENLLTNFLIEPEFAHRLMDTVLEVTLRVARNAIRAGADVIVIADDYAGNDSPFFSPAVFKTFVLPRLKRMVDAVHDEGAKVVKHSDGNLWPILDMIVDAGVDGLNPMEPIAGMDIGRIKQRYGERLCLIGNIDCAYILSEASTSEVEAAVKECIRRVSPGGGHIISSSNAIHSSVKPENFRTMIEATREFGKYPLPLKAPTTSVSVTPR